MTNFRKLHRMLLLLCYLAFLTGCVQSPVESSEEYILPNHWDGGLFSENPCRAPCFAGIIPGKTTESELMNVIKNNERFQGCELEDRPNQGRWVSCTGLIININKTDNIVDSLGFKTFQQFSIQDVIAKYGEPAMTWVIPTGIPEAPEVSIVVAWEEEKISINLESQEGVVYELIPSTAVTNIAYDSETDNDSTIFLQSWHGYGEYLVDND